MLLWALFVEIWPKIYHNFLYVKPRQPLWNHLIIKFIFRYQNFSPFLESSNIGILFEFFGGIWFCRLKENGYTYKIARKPSKMSCWLETTGSNHFRSLLKLDMFCKCAQIISFFLYSLIYLCLFRLNLVELHMSARAQSVPVINICT